MYNHNPVLLTEVVAGLAIKPDGIYIDATFGRGGHSKAILEKLGPQGRLLGIDKDPQALQAAAEQFSHDERFSMERGSFAMIQSLVDKHNWQGKVSGVLLDLGVSSPQLDDPARGFSFLRDGPLDMRMDPEHGLSAAQWLNSAKEADIAEVFFKFGEERFSRRIANAIVRERALAPFETTGRLAEVIKVANPAWERDKHPATRCFQAIRIFINNELTDLPQCLEQSLNVLGTGGRLVVISFHSLEDRIVKRFLRGKAKGDDTPTWIPLMANQLKQPKLRLIGRAIKPGDEEITINTRSRSAVLRIGEKML